MKVLVTFLSAAAVTLLGASCEPEPETPGERIEEAGEELGEAVDDMIDKAKDAVEEAKE